MDEPRWYVGEIEDAQLGEAARRLVAVGLRVFLPMVRRRGPYGDRRRRRRAPRFVAEPLFPGYLFVLIGPAGPWPRAADVPGLDGLICDGEGWPLPVRRGDVEAIAGRHRVELRRAREEAAAERRRAAASLIEPGDRVRVQTVAFHYKLGTVAALRGHGPSARGEILLDGESGRMTFSAPLSQLERIAPGGQKVG